MIGRLNHLSLGTRLASVVGALGFLAILLAVGGLIGMNDSARRLKTVYEDRIMTMQNLASIMDQLQEASILMLETSAKSASGEAIAVAPIKAKVQDIDASTDRQWKEFLAVQRSEAEKKPAEQYARARKTYFEEGLNPAIAALEKFNSVDFMSSYQRAVTIFGPMHDQIEILQKQQQELVKLDYETAATAFRTTRAVMIVALVLGLSAALAYATITVRSVTRRVTAVEHALAETARAHDLTQRVPVEGRDEVGRMADAFNTLMDELQQTLKSVVERAQSVSSSASEVASASGRITAASRAQAEAAASTAAAVEEVTVSIHHVADSTRDAKTVSDEATALSTSGEAMARDTSSQMAKTADSVAESMHMIKSLSQRSVDISGIVKVIRDIADQTNLLALNAAIEAARAGEQGRGFAVVADEVRKLAERTSASTSEISGMIEAIQQEVRNAVANLQTNNDQVAEGRRLAEEVAATLATIKNGAQTTMQRISSISAAAMQQGVASTDIARNVERIAQMTEEADAAISQAAAAASGLEALASELHVEVSRFRT